MNCKYCEGLCIKKGFQKDGTQKYACKICKKYQQNSYKYNAYQLTLNDQITRMVKRSGGIRDIAFILKISPTTTISRIRLIASKIVKPDVNERFQSYEMDEVSTIMRNGKEITALYVSYIINSKSSEVINFIIGRRDKITLRKVLSGVMCLLPKRICTDGWVSYPSLIPRSIHRVTKNLINKIERMHLTLRTRLKRMSRSFMCQTRKLDMLKSCLQIYFYG